MAESLRDPQATYGSVKAFMASVVKQGATDMFVAACMRRLDAEIRKAANMCVAHNASKDPAKPRYARVPSGETCGFCLMLSSFGFNYKTKEAASHSHPKCDCRVVPSFGKGSKVKGYDPDGMYDRFNECLDALGGRNGLWAEWDAMPDAEREAYIKAHGNKAGKAFDKYVNKRMVEEIELRDPKWYASGEHSGIEFTDSAVKGEKLKRWKKDPGERITAEKLNASAIRRSSGKTNRIWQHRTPMGRQRLAERIYQRVSKSRRSTELGLRTRSSLTSSQYPARMA